MPACRFFVLENPYDAKAMWWRCYELFVGFDWLRLHSPPTMGFVLLSPSYARHSVGWAERSEAHRWWAEFNEAHQLKQPLFKEKT
jgi:hypothetical protein